MNVQHTVKKEKTNSERRLIDLIKRNREANGLDQRALSIKINRSSVYVKRVEEGNKVYTKEDIGYLSVLFNKNFNELIVD